MCHLHGEKGPSQHSTDSVLVQDLSQQDLSNAFCLATQLRALEDRSVTPHCAQLH